MKIDEVLKLGNELLIKNEIEEASLKSKLLLAYVLNVSKEYLIIHDEEEVIEKNKEKYLECIRKNNRWRANSIYKK